MCYSHIDFIHTCTHKRTLTQRQMQEHANTHTDAEDQKTRTHTSLSGGVKCSKKGDVFFVFIIGSKCFDFK